MKGIDIIIPIYNAYDDLIKCVESVKKHTDLDTHRLILINDCSTDERILPYIRSEETERVIVIDNEANAGFSNNVNKGMLYSEDRDVLLLNSDTIVTENWIDKIVTCAYSNPEIGTVTPMSNSATLCSYPIMCQDNDIPENWTVDSLASVVERCSMKMYPRITVAVGFCMFIKREAIEKVGLFDAETFERGYGEENDFCNRAEQLGYIHVMCDDTFIYHKGTVSFLSEQKKALIEAHEKILVDRYPAQMDRNSKYCNSGLDQYIRENIHIYTKANPNKKNLMYLVQADFREDAFDNMGGTQHHVRDLTMHMKNEYNVYVVARDRDYLRVTLYTDNERVSLKYYIGEKEGFPRIHDTELENLFKNIITAFEINLLHVHHVYGLSFDIFDVAKQLGVPVYLTMHDYYFICPSVKLTNTEKQYCQGICNHTECANCLKKNARIHVSEQYLERWRNTCREAFAKCEKLIVPSNAAREIYLSHYPELENKLIVIEHGLEIEEDKIDVDLSKIKESVAVQYCFDKLFNDQNNPYAVSGWGYLTGVNSDEVTTILEVTSEDTIEYITCTRTMRMDVAEAKHNNSYIYSGFSCSIFKVEYLNKGIKIRVLMKHKDIWYTNGQYIPCVLKEEKNQCKYHVAFLGGMVPEKGSQKAYEMICNSSSDICWHIFGTIADADLIDLKRDNLVKHGTYKQQDIPHLLKENNIDVVCIMPIWPETFCYTLSEAVYCNVPVLVTDIGAAGERVRRHCYGWTVPVDFSGAEASEYLLKILNDEQEYAVKKEIVTYFSEITLEVMANAYKELYHDDEREFDSDYQYDSKEIFKGLGISAGMKDTPYLLNNIASSNQEVYQEIQTIWDEYLHLKDVEKSYWELKNSRSYRFLEKIKQNIFVRLLIKVMRKFK